MLYFFPDGKPKAYCAWMYGELLLSVRSFSEESFMSRGDALKE
jgi:hypothetical protein